MIHSRFNKILLSWSLFLAVCYALLLPAGCIGVAVGLASLGLALAACNRDTLATYLFLCGILTFGAIFAWAGYRGIGGKLAALLGLLLAARSRSFIAVLIRLRRPFICIVWLSLVLIVAYLIGPRTEYCQTLLLRCLITMGWASVGYAYLLWKPSVNWHVLGVVTIASAIAVLGCGSFFDKTFRPDHLFDVASVREKGAHEVYRPIGARDLSYLAVMGAILVSCATPDQPLQRRERVQLVAALLVSGLVVGWAFNRLNLVVFVTAFWLALFAKPKCSNRYLAIAAFSIILAANAFRVAYVNESKLVTQVLNSEESIAYRLNRCRNWEASLYLIRKSPWFGHGLGGYYVPGHAAAGEGTYPHNVVLHLLTELGIVGAAIFLAPMLFLLRLSRRSFTVSRRASGGALVLPLLGPVGLAAMGTGSLAKHMTLFALIAVILVTPPSVEHANTEAREA